MLFFKLWGSPSKHFSLTITLDGAEGFGHE